LRDLLLSGQAFKEPDVSFAFSIQALCLCQMIHLVNQDTGIPPYLDQKDPVSNPYTPKTRRTNRFPSRYNQYEIAKKPQERLANPRNA
jgi:hypothetical protein